MMGQRRSDLREVPSAYIRGRLKLQPDGQWVLDDIGVYSEANPSCITGIRFVKLNDRHTFMGRNFAHGLERAQVELQQLALLFGRHLVRFR